MLKKSVVMVMLLMVFMIVACSAAPVKSLVVKLFLRDVSVGSRPVQLRFDPDARVTFNYTSGGRSLSILGLRLNDPAREETTDRWVISGIPNLVASGRVTITYPGCNNLIDNVSLGDTLSGSRSYELVPLAGEEFSYYAYQGRWN